LFRGIILIFLMTGGYTLPTQSNKTRSGGYTDPACQGDRQVIVHLFEWKWDDIAAECEVYLGPKGYCGVQVSPPMEHILGPTWWTRYQPVSYLLESRSGTRAQFVSMVERCSAAGVNIIVDGVVNHMSASGNGVGTGGSSYSGQSYPGVPFSSQDFHHPICDIENYGDPTEVRNCYLVGLNDLDGSKNYVREKIAAYFQDCVDIGVKGFRIDAAKHMWPADLKATIDMVGDLPEGGRPFFISEVIDQGGEPIKVQEYFDSGMVTEFRYGIKVAESVRNGNLAALQGIYDEGWGMADYAHANVFIDNHDNQRSNGGGGNPLTHKEPFNYKLGTAFMLAHDYGFKRVMSSYYFTDKEEGPPSTSPGETGCGYPVWACEHRWDVIGNMVQFTNAVHGEPVIKWNVGSDFLAFARGNVGFFAMGALNKDFDTGLPDGDYCDIITECKQTVTVSGGQAHLSALDGDEAPAVAICVGCGDTTTTPRPATTTTKGPTTTDRPGPTTTTADSPTTSTLPATTNVPGECCEDIVITSSAGVALNYPELLGKYSIVGSENERDLYKHQTLLTTMHLHYTTDTEYRWEGWTITKDDDEKFGYVSNRKDNQCPTGLSSGWEFQMPGGWLEDATLAVTCDGETPPTAGPTSGPTGGPTTGPTNGPGPGGIAPTIVAIECVTTPGSDVFIVGGVAPDQPIDISLYPFEVQWEKYNLWRDGDEHLDWDGPEAGQGLVPGENDEEYEAMGTPAAWTTNKKTGESGPYYYELNAWGPNYWFIVMDMDCDQTQDGWFEFNTVYSIGGETGEPSVSQEECTGSVGGTAPFLSTNHIARCGFFNVFSYGTGECQIDAVPDPIPDLPRADNV